MKRTVTYLFLVLLATCVALPSQTLPGGDQSQSASARPTATKAQSASPQPFSRLALEGGIGLGGINMQAAVEANRYLNIRGIGNYFSYSVNNVKVNGSGGANGIDVSGKLNLAEAGVALDYYPWPNHGFRLSPGVTFYNNNGASASGVSSEGTSMTLGSTKYYSEAANPMSLSATLGLDTHKQAFTMTTGWGNMISRRGGHWSFPFELGAIFTGAPTLNLNIAGYGCATQADAADNGESCVNMATNTTAQANIASQVAKYQSDLNPLKVYPIISFGLAYNFQIH